MQNRNLSDGVEQLTVRIPTALAMLSLGRSKIYGPMDQLANLGFLVDLQPLAETA